MNPVQSLPSAALSRTTCLSLGFRTVAKQTLLSAPSPHLLAWHPRQGPLHPPEGALRTRPWKD